MNIKVISVQRNPQKEIEHLESDFLKRLRSMIKLNVITIRPKSDARDREKTLREEEKLIQKEINKDEILVVLDDEGKEFSTPEFAAFMDNHMKIGTKNLAFLIGGPLGVSNNLLNQAQTKWSLSRLTFPHRIVRLLVLECLYRTLDYLKGGPYHKS